MQENQEINNENIVSFESKINEAKKHLDKLMNPEITLSASVKEYKNGIKELEIAQKLLDEAKLQYEEVNI
jgi:exodeoxyribonuclease VII small subunit